MFDCHVHSKFSIDSETEIAEACEAAISLGLSGLAFTDHLDLDSPGSDLSWYPDFDKYIPEISKVQAAYKGRLNILKAIEAGVQPHVISESREIVESYPFDYVLASIHIIGGIDPYFSRDYYDQPKTVAYERYLKEIYFIITHFSNYDMVGHFEYVIRYAQYADRSLRYVDHTDIFDAILNELIKQGRGFEVNTGTFRDPTENVEYDASVLKRYRELGGELICLGSDAHRLNHIGIRFNYFSRLLLDAGFNYTVHFEERKPVFDRLG